MNNKDLVQVGFGGGCHWCTEAVFASLRGVTKVRQGWIASDHPFDNYSEAVFITFNKAEINLIDLISVHVNTHASSANHSMRKKYRSAIYYMNEIQKKEAVRDLDMLQNSFQKKIITNVLPFVSFRENIKAFQNYFYNEPEKPFCKTYIQPKIELLKKQFTTLIREQL